MSSHIIAMLVAAALVAALLAAIARMIATSEPATDVDTEGLDASEAEVEEFVAELVQPFTDEPVGPDEAGDVFAPAAPAAPAAGGRHHADTVEFVALDYLIERAYATRIAPRTRVAGRAAVPE